MGKPRTCIIPDCVGDQEQPANPGFFLPPQHHARARVSLNVRSTAATQNSERQKNVPVLGVIHQLLKTTVEVIPQDISAAVGVSIAVFEESMNRNFHSFVSHREHLP